MPSIAFRPSATLADVTSALEFQLIAALGAGVDDLPLGLVLFLLFEHGAVDLPLHLLVHVHEGMSDSGRTTGSFAGVVLRVRTEDEGWA